MPEPPQPRERETNVIPITRARTTPPQSFGSVLDRRPTSQMTAVSPSMVANAAIALPLPAPEPEVAPPPPAVPPRVDPREQWKVFEDLGLGAPKPATQKQNTQKMLVSAYRGLGFVILSIIVVVLVGYIATSAFYFVSDSWVQPMVVSETDERVVALESQLIEQENERDRVAAELAHVDRTIALQQSFQLEFAAAIRADLSGRKNELDRVRELAREYAGARSRIQKSNAAYASASRRKMQQEYAARLIDRNEMLSGKYQLAQITSSSLTLAERQAEYETRAAELETEAAALDAILSQKGGEGTLSYDVLRIKREYDLSRLETAKAVESREALKAALARQEEIIEELRQSPYLRALEDEANVAFVPYGNLDEVSAGAAVYGCALEMIFCSRVGTVIEILPGEVTFKHPHREKILRGQMVEIDLADDDAATKEVLFVGDKPLLF